MPNEKLDRAGRSQLHYAALDGDTQEAACLIRAGAQVNLKDVNGYTPLHFAAQEQKVEVARVLSESGAEIDAKDNNGNTPLFRAVFNSRGNGDLIQLLRRAGADPLVMNNHGISPVKLARQIANYDVAQYFADLPK